MATPARAAPWLATTSTVTGCKAATLAVSSTGQAVRVPDVRSLITADASLRMLTALRGLLDEAFDGDFGDEDWEHALGGWHVVVTDGDLWLAHAAVVPRDLDVGDRRFRAGYVEGVATTPRRHRAGLGSLAMGEIAGLLRRHFELGALSTGRHSFYERLGWERWRGSTLPGAAATSCTPSRTTAR